MKNKYQKVKPINTHRRLYRLLALFLIIGLFVAGGVVLTKRDNSAKKENNATAADEATVDYGPPSEEDLQAAEDNKDKILNEEQAPPVIAADGRRQVTPIIASADSSGVSAYITGIFEENGTCTAEFTHGNDKVSVTSQGFGNSNYTSCEPLTLDSPLNIQGDWNVTVSYSSATSSGVSSPTLIKVP